MKIVDEYYVLIRLGTIDKGVYRGDFDSYTVFLGKDETFVDDIRSALKFNCKKAAMLFLQDYERKHDFEPSELSTLYVRNEITW